MKTELTRFKVKENKSKVVDEWMQFLNDNMKEVLLTLDNEKMYIENIFRETVDDVDYLYWYSIQGENGLSVEESQSWIDKKHLEYWYECIDEEYKPVDLKLEVQMISQHLQMNEA